MDNVYTLMVFETGQPQAVVLQYKGRDHARRDRDIMKSDSPEKVTIIDDFGRELTFRPMNVQTSLLQDVDQASEGNTIANVKNAVSNTVAQTLAQTELEKDPAMKAALARARLMQGANGGGAFRA